MSAQAHPRLTPEQYLENEKAAEFKSDYYDGRMFAMPPRPYWHSITIANLTLELHRSITIAALKRFHSVE